MQCKVCHVAFDDPGPCPQCRYDALSLGADELSSILRAREAWKAKTTAYAPDTRVTLFDKCKPWLGVALGALFFLFWLRACYGHGRVF